MKLEICAGSYNSALAALNGGADRIELCSGLGEGGLTPSAGLIKAACQLSGIKKHVLIRPRGGDFLYTDAEKAIILDDIQMALDYGADGVVVGALLADGTIDVPFLNACMKAANGHNVTFHRAFDLCADALTALEQIKEAGCTRILTSGQAGTAEEGLTMLKKLVQNAGNDLIIMPGCGVSPANAAKILKESGAKEIHASASGLVHSKMEFRLNGVEMGKGNSDEYTIKESSEETVRSIVNSLKTLS